MVFSSSPIREKHIKWFCNFITVTYAILVLLDTHHVSPRNRIKTSLVTLISTCTAFLATAWREGMSPGVDRKSKAPPKSQFRKAWHGPLEELKRTTKASKHSLRNCVRSPKLFISLFGRLPLFLSGGFIVRERERQTRLVLVDPQNTYERQVHSMLPYLMPLKWSCYPTHRAWVNADLKGKCKGCARISFFRVAPIELIDEEVGYTRKGT